MNMYVKGIVGTNYTRVSTFLQWQNSMIFFQGVFANFQVQFEFLNVALAYFWDSLTSTAGDDRKLPNYQYLG